MDLSTTPASPERQLADDVGFTSTVQPIREVSPQEQFTLLQSCLEDAGWEASVEQDGGLHVNVLSEQQLAYDHQKAECLLLYPIADRYLRPWSEEQYSLVYDHWEQETVPCLRELGLHPAPLPSRESFIDSSLRGSPNFYLNQAIEKEVLQDQASSVVEIGVLWSSVCPYHPPDDILYPVE